MRVIVADPLNSSVRVIVADPLNSISQIFNRGPRKITLTDTQMRATIRDGGDEVNDDNTY